MDPPVLYRDTRVIFLFCRPGLGRGSTSFRWFYVADPKKTKGRSNEISERVWGLFTAMVSCIDVSLNKRRVGVLPESRVCMYCTLTFLLTRSGHSKVKTTFPLIVPNPQETFRHWQYLLSDRIYCLNPYPLALFLSTWFCFSFVVINRGM